MIFVGDLGRLSAGIEAKAPLQERLELASLEGTEVGGD